MYKLLLIACCASVIGCSHSSNTNSIDYDAEEQYLDCEKQYQLDLAVCDSINVYSDPAYAELNEQCKHDATKHADVCYHVY